MRPANRFPPIAVGGVGGSGTRLVSRLLHDAGVFMGDDVNDAGDNLWFTLLFKHASILEAGDEHFTHLLEAFVSAMDGDPPLTDEALAIVESLAAQDRMQHDREWLRKRRDTLVGATASRPPHRRWAWKEPNTHVVIERLWERLPDLRYVHVVRHGLDMAYSRNQNQLRLWGRHVLDREPDFTPVDSLAYWCRVQQRMESLLARNRHRMYWLDYDAFCANADEGSAALARFLMLDDNPTPSRSLEIARPPARHHAWSREGFSASDIEYVRSLGYRIADG